MGTLRAELLHVRSKGGAGARTLLEEISFEAKTGELWVVLGPNGAGKSTLLRTLLGLERPAGGRVFWNGKPLDGLPPRARARALGWVPQSFEPAPGLTGLELVLMGRAPHTGPWHLASEEDEQGALAVLDELGLRRLAPRRLEALSGGELRLLLLARALVQAPELLLLDEPTAFLDVRHQVETLRAVRRRVAMGMGAVAVLHDVNLAAAFADRVLLLQSGRVLAQGERATVLTREHLTALYGVEMQTAHSEEGSRVFLPSASGEPHAAGKN